MSFPLPTSHFFPHSPPSSIAFTPPHFLGLQPAATASKQVKGVPPLRVNTNYRLLLIPAFPSPLPWYYPTPLFNSSSNRLRTSERISTLNTYETTELEPRAAEKGNDLDAILVGWNDQSLIAEIYVNVLHIYWVYSLCSSFYNSGRWTKSINSYSQCYTPFSESL
jgi:hypothetical protein